MDIVEQIESALTNALGPLGPLMLVGGLGLALVLMVLPGMMNQRKDPLDKLRNANNPARQSSPINKLRTRDKAEKLDRFAHFLEPQNEVELSASRLKMMRAGYRTKNAVRVFHAAQFLLGIGGLVAGVLYALLSGAAENSSATNVLMMALVPGVIGYYLPIYWVTRRVQEREEQMVQGFPDALDMMLVCVEAGQALDQSINRVAKEIKIGYPALGEEFEIVSYEIKAGKERAQVLRDFGERAGIADINSFVTTIIQSQTYGSSIGEALRIYGAEMRDKRVMRAEEKANKLPTKITLGTMMFTVPPLLLALIGPSIMLFASGFGGR